MTVFFLGIFLVAPNRVKAKNNEETSPKVVRVKVASVGLPFSAPDGNLITSKSSHKKYLKVESPSGKIKVGIHQLPSPIYLNIKNSFRADVILELGLEKYLEGVMVGEMPSNWPLEALKAQAIAARSYTLAQIKLRENDDYQLEGDVLDQVYSLNHSSENIEKIKQALSETKNTILTQGLQPLKAYYHSDCGGQTEEPENVWGVKELKIGTTKDKFCSVRHNSWQYKISKKELMSKISQFSSEFSFVESVNILMRSESQRVAYLALNGHGKTARVSGQEMRQIIGFDKIKSTLFSLTSDEQWVTFSGRGNGHGSGLCQWGARSMALQGKTASEILRHYYPRAERVVVETSNIRPSI